MYDSGCYYCYCCCGVLDSWIVKCQSWECICQLDLPVLLTHATEKNILICSLKQGENGSTFGP